jgi:hypothetical protein
MLKRLFLSIVILSTLAYEGGAAFPPDLIDYYLINLANLGIIQDSRSAISGFDAQKLNSSDKKGTPIAFFKQISQNSLSSKSSSRNRHFESLGLPAIAIFSVVFILFLTCLKNIISVYTMRRLLNLADSSPPAYC